MEHDHHTEWLFPHPFSFSYASQIKSEQCFNGRIYIISIYKSTCTSHLNALNHHYHYLPGVLFVWLGSMSPHYSNNPCLLMRDKQGYHPNHQPNTHAKHIHIPSEYTIYHCEKLAQQEPIATSWRYYLAYLFPLADAISNVYIRVHIYSSPVLVDSVASFVCLPFKLP